MWNVDLLLQELIIFCTFLWAILRPEIRTKIRSLVINDAPVTSLVSWEILNLESHVTGMISNLVIANHRVRFFRPFSLFFK